jgi:hypothetical protein
MRLKYSGLTGIEKALKDASERVPNSLKAALFHEGQRVRAISVSKTPLDLGILRGSAYVSRPVDLPSGPAVEVGYAGDADAYAVVQHERTDFKHRVGEAKFLEKALAENAQGYFERLAKAAAKAMELVK